jgi:protein AbiQ
MEVVRLNQDLFNKDKLKGKEISNNKNASRPYYYSFKRNDTNRVCIPFRTNTKMVPDKYKMVLLQS